MEQRKQNETENISINVPVSDGLFRPKTRGELYNKLKEGVKCEVVASNEEWTSLCLESLNALGNGNVKFKTYPSENYGWVIYEAV